MPRKPIPAVTVEEVTTVEGLERLRPEWNSLWARSRSATPFQSPAWLIPWWKHIGEGELWTLALRHEGRLVGLLPLYIYTDSGGVRQVFLLGIATTDYLDGLFERGFEGCGMAATFAHLDGRRDRWDVCDFQQLRPGSPLLEAPPPPGWSADVMGGEPCPFLPLPATVEEFPGCVPPRLRDNLRYYERRAGKIGPMRIESANGKNLDELFDALLRLHRARWSTKGESGVLALENVQRSHRESLPDLLSPGALRLYGMRLGGRLVAALYGFADTARPRRRFYYYLSGFDPEFEHLSLGTLMIGHAVREAIREGAAEFDFLRGQESYKYLWGAQDRQTYRRQLWHA